MTAPPPTLLGAWRCAAAHDAVVRGGTLLDGGELTAGGAAVVGHGAAGAACVLVGEITEPGRLRAALRDPSPRTDASAIATGFEQYGANVLGLLRGQWTVVLWDPARRSGLLACDPLAGRGLHYAVRGEGLVFGEEARDVVSLLAATPAPDREQTVRWILSGTVDADAVLYRGIRRLEGGSLLRLAPGAAPARYWNPRPSDVRAIGFEEAAADVRAAVDTAVRRVVRGRRAGVQLSGGLDSSTVAASALATGEPARLVAYSGMFDGVPDADETALVDLLADTFAIDSVRSTVTDGRALASGLAHLAAWRLPLNSGQTFLWDDLLRRAVADGVEVMLDGQGGDEVFGNDVFTLVADALRHGRVDRAWEVTGRLPGWHVDRRSRLRVMRHFAPVAAPGTVRTAVRALRGRGTAVSPLARPEDQAVAAAVADYRFAPLERRSGPLWWRVMAHRLTDLRAEIDAPGMFRRRGRLLGFTPAQPLLLDQDLVELALRLPGELHLDPRHDRPVARVAAKGRVPDAVRLRAGKSHFSDPFVASMLGPERDLVLSLLEPRAARVRAFVEPAGLDGHLRALTAGTGRPNVAWCQQTWRLAMMECWLRELEQPGVVAEMEARTPPARAAITVRAPSTS